MGMYTGLRGTVNVSEKYQEAMRNMVEEYANWEDVLPEGHPYLAVGRKNFIPFGGVCYMPDDWEAAEGSSIDSEGVLTFCCSLKNYNDEIGTFVKTVLPLIADSWDLEELYEEDEISTKHIG